ncbi:MAG: GNAT family N-acetyltransferase [Odoribacter sp.]
MEEFITDKWDDLLTCFSAESKDIYFDESYVKLYEDDHNRGFCYVYREDEAILLFPFLRRSFYFNQNIYYDFETVYGYGGPIINVRQTAFTKRAFISLKHFFEKEGYVAGFIRFHPLLNNQSLFGEVSSIIRDRQTIAIDLEMSEEDIWMKEIHTKNRNTIKRGINNGLSFIVDEKYQYIDEFIKLYNSTMQRLSADNFYFFPENYYNNLIQRLKNNFLGIVLYEGKVVSGALFFYSTDYGHYHLSGSDVNYLSLCPNNYMLYEAALELKKRGVRKFHLGGGTTSGENDSLFCFKERFSKNRYWFNISKLIFNQSVYDALCQDWKEKNPDKSDKYKNFLLRYKY